LAQQKITTRWLTGGLGLIIIILVLVEVILGFAVRIFYYNSVRQILLGQANTVSKLIETYAKDDSAHYMREVLKLIENFEARDRMELMSIDANGNVLTTSSGFEVTERMVMPDFQNALNAANKIGEFRGEINGENIFAVSMLAPSNDESLVAVRLVVSLTRVDNNILALITGAVLFGIAVIFFIVLSGSYFISSIVIPVTEIGRTARRIAQGDFGTRLNNKNNDEIGQLCETINYMAEELSNSEKMKNDFISSISHELRTPLTAIKGWSETILDMDEINRDTVTKGMRVIISETDRLALMVEELLDFSRIQSGHLKLVMDRIDLLAELEEAVLMYTQKARRESISLEYEEETDSAVVVADKNRMRQVFINIIDNAIKYSDPGGFVRVRVSETDGYILVSVQDSGCGISADDLPSVKKKFFKANTARRGSGIGLAVADEIIAAHDGELDIASELGSGTTVTIKIPTAKRYEALQQQREAKPVK
jgi:signal transduction histidine kinase